MPRSETTISGAEVYSAPARRFHWLTAAMVAVMVPLGLYMVARGATTNFDAISGALYNVHKAIGFLLLLVVAARLVYRLRNGAPPDEPSLEPWQRLASHAVHWALYGLLIVVPMLGWIGVSMYGARGIIGPIALPPIAPENQPASEVVFWLHYLAALLLTALALGHAAMALYHRFVRKDGVLTRMLPGRSELP